MRGIAACCVLALCGGCSLLFASNLEGDGASPDSDAGSSIDAASVPDTATALDAPAGDAPVGQPDGSTRFCTTLTPTPKFCVDFDESGATANAAWDRFFMSPQDAGVIELTDVARAGKALSVRMNNAPDCSYTRAEKTFATTGKDLRVSFSFRPTTPWTTDAIYAMVRLSESGATKCRIFPHLGTDQGKPSGGDIHFQYGPSNTDEVFTTVAAPKGDVWSKVEMTLRANGSLLLTVDGTTATDRPVPAGCTFGDGVDVGLGYHCENASPEVRFDDVVIDYP